MNDVNKPAAAEEKTSTSKPATAQQNVEAMTLNPSTDIHEAKDGVTLYVDLPGVSKESLKIDVDDDVLSIRGGVSLHTPENLEPTYMDVHSGVYERRFTIGEQLDSEGIEAHLNQGELKLFIPRTEKHKPRKIEIKVG